MFTAKRVCRCRKFWKGSLPSACGSPIHCETNIPQVNANWCRTPIAPLMFTGAISVKYIGTNPVPAPVRKNIVFIM